jgi:hypothetical protein
MMIKNSFNPKARAIEAAEKCLFKVLEFGKYEFSHDSYSFTFYFWIHSRKYKMDKTGNNNYNKHRFWLYLGDEKVGYDVKKSYAISDDDLIICQEENYAMVGFDTAEDFLHIAFWEVYYAGAFT